MFSMFGKISVKSAAKEGASSPSFDELKGPNPSGKVAVGAKGRIDVGSGKAAIKSSGALSSGKKTNHRSPRQMLPQESPSNLGWLSSRLQKDQKDHDAFEAMAPLTGVVASYDAMMWEPSKELSCFPHQSMKTSSWKQMLRNPYTRVFALDYERVKRGEPRFTVEWIAPSMECMSWEPSKELSCFPHQSMKTSSWKQMLRNPYTRVFALDYERVKRGESRFTIEWIAPNVECMSWEPSKQLSSFPHQSMKTSSWKQMLRNPYTRVFALDYERVKRGEPRWTAKAEEWDCYDALSWSPSPQVANRTVPHQSPKSTSWKFQLSNPYVRVFAYDFERAKSGEPRWK